MSAKRRYFDDYYLTRLVQEEAKITRDRWYIFEAEKPGETAWTGRSQEEGEAWAKARGIAIDMVVPNNVRQTHESYREMCSKALEARDARAAERGA